MHSENSCKSLNMAEMPVITWMKLDNAAKIYPAARSRRSPGVFRLSMELTENIDADILFSALERTLKRLPGFSQRLQRGLFWYYLEHQDNTPPIQKDSNNPWRSVIGSPLDCIYAAENGTPAALTGYMPVSC